MKKLDSKIEYFATLKNSLEQLFQNLMLIVPSLIAGAISFVLLLFIGGIVLISTLIGNKIYLVLLIPFILVAVLVSIFFQVVLFGMVSKVSIGLKATLSEGFAYAKKLFLKYLGATILLAFGALVIFGIGVLLIYLLTFIPHWIKYLLIFLMVLILIVIFFLYLFHWFFLEPVLIYKTKDIIKSTFKIFCLNKKESINAALVLILTSVALTIFFMILSFIPIISSLVSIAISLFFTPWIILYKFNIYNQLKNK